MRKHQQAYNDTDTADSSSLGVGAALQALKKFNGGATGDSQDKGAFMGLAMSEASKVRINLPKYRLFFLFFRRRKTNTDSHSYSTLSNPRDWSLMVRTRNLWCRKLVRWL